MKSLLLASLAFIAIQSAAGFKKCPEKIPKGTPAAPRAGKYYQVMRPANANDEATCYNMKISGSGKQLTIDQSMIVNNMTLNHTYIATSNVNGTWDVTKNGETKDRLQLN